MRDTAFSRGTGGTLSSTARDGKACYSLTDDLGSVVAPADKSGTKVNSYTCSHRDITRAARSEKVTQPYRFAGSYQDPTGLRHLSVRYYDPTIGRFNSPDPPARRRPLPLRRGRPSQLKRP